MRTIVLAAAVVLGAGAALAQGNQGADDLSQDRTGGGESQASQAQAAHVGAGTTDGATNGFSQPAKPGGGSGGPAKLEASLCDSVKDETAHDDCLSKVLGTGAKP